MREARDGEYGLGGVLQLALEATRTWVTVGVGSGQRVRVKGEYEKARVTGVGDRVEYERARVTGGG